MQKKWVPKELLYNGFYSHPFYFRKTARKLNITNDNDREYRAFRERRAIARAFLRTRLTHWRRAIYRSPKIMATVHDD